MSPTGSKPRGDPRGFTLFELLVVMAILGLFSSLLFSRVGGLAVEGGLREAGRMIANEIRGTRNLAATTRGEQRLGFDLDRNLIAVPSAGLEGRLEADDGERLLPDGVRLEDVVIRGTGFRSGRAEIRFHPDGSTEGALIHLRDDEGRVRTLELMPLTGAIRAYGTYVAWEDE